MAKPGFVPYRPERIPIEETASRARAFFEQMDARRSVRMFSPDPVPRSVIDDIIRTASTAPSGAHRQPWRFVIVGDAPTKKAIREAAEAEERANYSGGRLPPDWREALEPLGTDEHRAHFDEPPWGGGVGLTQSDTSSGPAARQSAPASPTWRSPPGSSSSSRSDTG